MKKKNIKVLLITLGIIIILTASVFAVENVKKLIGPPVVEEPTAEEIREALLKEKEEYSNENIRENYLVQSYSLEEDTELTEKLNEANSKAKEIEETIISIMNKFYPNEFKIIMNKLNNSGEDREAQEQLCYLIKEILENETLSEMETANLNEFVNSPNLIK